MMSNGQVALLKKEYLLMIQKLKKVTSINMESGSPRRGKRRDIRSDRTKYQCIVNVEDQDQKCLAFVRREVDTIQKESYKLLKGNKLKDRDVYMTVYDMNQKLHHIKQILDTYCCPKNDSQLFNSFCFVVNDQIIGRLYMFTFRAG